MPRERVKHGDIRVTEKHEDVDGIPGAILEYIYDPHDPNPLPANTVLYEEPSLDISWGREAGYVQVSIDFTREQWLEVAKELEEHPGTIKKAIHTMPLTRYEINNAIKTLRRARDAAYGKDE
jgi:hypothetical protein